MDSKYIWKGGEKVAKRAGIPGAERWVDARTLKTDEEIEAAAEDTVVFGRVTPEQKRRLIEGATDLLHDVLGKNKATTVVTIDEVDTDNWGIGGVPVTEIRKKGK